jgi:PAS domain-containing protein
LWDRRVVPETSTSRAAEAAARSVGALGSWLTSVRPPWSESTTVEEADGLAAGVAQRLASAVGPAAVGLLTLEADGSLRLVGAAGVPATVLAAWARLPHQLHTPPMEVVQRGRPSWLPDLTKVRHRYLVIGEADELWPSRAWLPIRDGNRIVGVAGVLCTCPQEFGPAVRRVISRRVAELTPAFLRLLSARQPSDWAGDAQALLDLLPGAITLCVPVRDDAGRVVDYEVTAASPGAADAAGRRGRELVGLRMLETYPPLRDSDLPAAMAQVLASGRSREVGPHTYPDHHGALGPDAVHTMRLHRLGAALLVTWVRHDEDRRHATRLALTERLGDLGWVEWDLAADTVYWSDRVMAILGRAPGEGPARLEDLPRIVVPGDLGRFEGAVAGLLDRRTPMDLTFRARIRGDERHLRTVIEGDYDIQGRPVRVYGIVQDVTAGEAEHRLVARLQQIILPLPAGPIDRPGLRLAVHYRPAEQAARLGGDWYDLVDLPAGRTLMAVGDVAGHGLSAAGTMARLRHALAALAVTTTEPAELLRYLNRMVCDDPAEPTATVVVARYDPATAMLTWAQAGHPPPILVAPGVARLLARPTGALIGARRDTPYANAEVRLPPGATVLLYTDGLIERRTGSVGDWARPVLAALTGAEREPVEALLDRLRPANPDDDTCVLVLRRAEPPGRGTRPAA